MGPRACKAHFWEPKSPKTVHWIPWPDRATSFALFVGRATSLCSHCSIPLSAGLLDGHPVSWVCRFGFMVSHSEGCIHSKQGCKLVSLPWQSRKTGCKADTALCGLDLSAPTSQVPWLNIATGFALQVVSSACQILCLNAAWLCSFQVSWLGFWAAFHSVQGYCSPVWAEWRTIPQDWTGSLTQAYSHFKFHLQMVPPALLCRQWVLPATLCSSIARLHSFQVFWPAILASLGWELSLAMCCAMTHISYLVRGKQAFSSGNTFHLRTWVRETCVLLCSLVRLHHCLSCAGEQSTIGTTTWGLQVGIF